ncbi:hypothetical protein VaNZ11_016598 [Volvox africanus]|uniref:Uncharacterized protein n=1 Tax=Volvox africanus TaxID=51714 RepID=A0ABQ5SNR3_9CHLO|nr:hypothetical protein VaNZ11_016598 [Volvox africanus]
MGRIEALTRALNSLRKVGIRTRTESEDGDGFGRWAGLGTADKPIGTSKATVYASLAGRNRASDVWRRRAQLDDDYQQFLAENRAEQVSESSKKDELTEHELPAKCLSPQERQQQQQQKQKLPSKQRSQSHIDTEAQKRRSRHSSVTLYAADVCDVRPGRQGTSGSESIICAGHGEPPSTPFTSEQGWLSPSPSMLGGGGGGSATGTPRQAPPPLPLGHISRSRSSSENLLSTSCITVGGSSCGIGGSNAGTPRNCGPGGGGGAAAAGPIPPWTNSTSVPTTGLQPAPSVLLRSSTSFIVGGDSGSGSGAYSSSGAGGGGSWGSCICGGGIGCSGTSCQNQPLPAANGSSFLRLQGSTIGTNDAAATATATAGAATATKYSITSVISAGVTASSSVVRLPSLRQMTQLQHHPSMRTLRSSTAAGALAGTATNDCIRQQYFQPQPPTQPPTPAAPTQVIPVPMQQPVLALQLQQQQFQQQQQQQQVPPHKAWDQPRPPTAAVEFRDGRGRERTAGSGPQPPGTFSSRRAGIATGPTLTSPAVPAAHPVVLSRGQSAQSLMNMLAAAGGSGGSVGSYGGGGSCGGVSSSSYASGSNAGRDMLCPAASEVAVAGLPNLDDAIPLNIVDGTGRWFDAGDLSYCNPDCDDEMAQILDELMQSGRVGSGTGSGSAAAGVGASFSRGNGGRLPSGLSHGSVADAAAAVSLPGAPRPTLGPNGSSISRRFGSMDVTSPQIPDVSSLPLIQGSSGGGAVASAASAGPIGRRGGGGGIGTITGSFTGGSSSVGGGCYIAGYGSSCRGSDSLLPRLPWAGSMYGSAGGSGVGGGTASPSGVASPSATAAAAVACVGSSFSPCASPQNFSSSYHAYGSSFVSVDSYSRTLVDGVEDMNASAAAAVAVTGGTVAAGSGMRQPSQSFRRSSQLLIQAAGRRASTGLPPNMAAVAAAASVVTGVFPDPNSSRTTRVNSSGGALEVRTQ